MDEKFEAGTDVSLQSPPSPPSPKNKMVLIVGVVGAISLICLVCISVYTIVLNRTVPVLPPPTEHTLVCELDNPECWRNAVMSACLLYSEDEQQKTCFEQEVVKRAQTEGRESICLLLPEEKVFSCTRQVIYEQTVGESDVGKCEILEGNEASRCRDNLAVFNIYRGISKYEDYKTVNCDSLEDAEFRSNCTHLKSIFTELDMSTTSVSSKEDLLERCVYLGSPSFTNVCISIMNLARK